ncbi:unnamed protein product [Closterium sp. Naga37s-1]|nr:unnamed protein product [Closterium sp. Naga37s-1]
MGLDGGTIISRTDVIRGASWRLASRDSARSTRGGQLSAGDLLGGEERVGAREQRDAAWSACALTGEALREPIVVCQLGRLYNRESVLQLLLWRAGVVAEESHKWCVSQSSVLFQSLSRIPSLPPFPLHPSPLLYLPSSTPSLSPPPSPRPPSLSASLLPMSMCHPPIPLHNPPFPLQWRFTRLQDQLHRFAHIRFTKVRAGEKGSRGIGGNGGAEEGGSRGRSRFPPSPPLSRFPPSPPLSRFPPSPPLSRFPPSPPLSRFPPSPPLSRFPLLAFADIASCASPQSTMQPTAAGVTVAGVTAMRCHRQQWPAVRTGQQSTRGSRAHRAAGHTGQQGTRASLSSAPVDMPSAHERWLS